MKNNKRKYIKIFTSWILISCSFFTINAQTSTQILEKVDECINGPADQTMNMKLVLIDKSSKEYNREIIMYQKGSDKRIGKFLSPADQKGIGFLSLPDNIFYIYLPAYKKTRRIASQVKNTKFAGTDFTYEDMAAQKYTDNWNVVKSETENNQYRIELTPKQGVSSEYGKLVLWVGKDNFYPVKIEYYDKGNNLAKLMTRDKVEKIDGFWISKESMMEDLKSGHKTKMILEDVKFNTGIADSKFTERYLAQ